MSGRGFLLSVAAAFWAAAFLIPYQAASQRADRASVLAAMLLSAAVFNTLVLLVREGRRAFVFDRPALTVSAMLTVGTIVGNIAIAMSLLDIGPGMTSVVLKSQVVLIPLFAWPLIDERPTKTIVVGAILGLGGFALLQAGATRGLAGAPWWALLGAATFGLMQVATKNFITRIRPAQVNATRLWLAVAVMLLLPRSAGGGQLQLDAKTWLLAATAGVMGPGISRLCLMYALRHVTASFTALVSLFGPVFAFGFGYLVFTDVPTKLEIAGSVLILSGVAYPVVIAWRARENSRVADV